MKYSTLYTVYTGGAYNRGIHGRNSVPRKTKLTLHFEKRKTCIGEKNLTPQMVDSRHLWAGEK